MKEKDLGTSEITISKLGPDRFMFTNRVSGAFAQQWKALATATFVPVSAKRTFGEGDKLRPRFELNYREERAIGWRLEKSTLECYPTPSIRESTGPPRCRKFGSRT